MYEKMKSPENVIKYLYENNQDDLAQAVIDLIKRCERAEAVNNERHNPVEISTGTFNPSMPPYWQTYCGGYTK